MKTMQSVAAALALAFLPWSGRGQDDLAATTKVKVGDVAPDFTCQTLSRKDFSLGKEKGKVILINFFATWCGPCLAEMPRLEKEIFDKYKDRKDFLLIAIGREHEAPELKKFQKAKGFSIPIAPDPKREIYARYAEKYIPRNVLVGKDGKIKFASVGFSEKDFGDLVQAVQRELESGVASTR